jgi:hypothetical protein
MTKDELIKTALDELDQYQVRRYAQHLYNVRNALYKALQAPKYNMKDILKPNPYVGFDNHPINTNPNSGLGGVALRTSENNPLNLRNKND